MDSLPSRTALRVALRRAAHQLVDATPLVFPDPFAVPILGPHAGELTRTPRRVDRPHSAALRAFLVARSRFAEDTLRRAVAQGVTQYVILGAGLDTFSLRNPYPGLRVFEVDHPATQAWKRDLLAVGSLHLPSTASLVPVDLEHDDLRCRLELAGFDRGRPTLFALLGVVPYLPLEVFRETIFFIASQPSRSAVVLDYGLPRTALPPLEQLAHDSLTARVRLAGEPFQSFFTPDTMQGELSAFPHIQDLGRDQLNRAYFEGRSDSLRLLGTASRLLHAWRLEGGE